MKLTGKSNETYRISSKPLIRGRQRGGFSFDKNADASFHAVVGRPDLVAKLYKKSAVTPTLEAELSAMLFKKPNKSVLSQVAWVRDILYRDGRFVGYVMTYFDLRQSLYACYGYGKAVGDSAVSLEKKICIARNLYAVIHEIHYVGQVVGDLNSRNILVDTENAPVAFVETDHYGILDIQYATRYRATRGMAEYLPREVQMRLNGRWRLADAADSFTIATDRFGLAIHIFQLLMNGVHPFLLSNLSEIASVEAPSPIHSLLNGICVFSPQVGTLPPHMPLTDSLSDEIRQLFVRAFVDGHQNPAARTRAKEWMDAPDRFRFALSVCSQKPDHRYNATLPQCPWCAIDAIDPCGANGRQIGGFKPLSDGGLDAPETKPILKTCVITVIILFILYSMFYSLWDDYEYSTKDRRTTAIRPPVDGQMSEDRFSILRDGMQPAFDMQFDKR